MYIGIDIGGTNIRVASTASLTRPHLAGKIIFPNSRSYPKDKREIIQAIKQLSPTIDGIGIALPGGLSKRKLTIVSSSYVHQWHHRYLARTLKAKFKCPVVIEHDSKAAALGEALYGGIEGKFARIGYGTGLNAAIIYKGPAETRIKDILAAEFDEYIAPWGRACGGRSVEREFGKTAAQLQEHEWGIVLENFNQHLLKFIEVYKPPNIVFGGGIAVKQADRLLADFAALQASRPELSKTQFSITRLGEDEGLYGAIGLLLRA